MEPNAPNRPVEPICSYQVCTAGHTWPLELGIARCPGCKSQMIARKQESCPVCNEPAERMMIRLDHINERVPVVALCKGATPMAQSGIIEIKREPTPDEAELMGASLPTEESVVGAATGSPAGSPEAVNFAGSAPDIVTAEAEKLS